MTKTGYVISAIILALVFLALGGALGWQAGKAGGLATCEEKSSPLDASYTIEGELYVLNKGQGSSTSNASVSKVKMVAWGEPTMGELNSDGKEDSALIFIQQGEGSGTFYYVAGALKNSSSDGYSGTNALLLGDRIAPINISIENQTISVLYKDRAENDPMAISPYIEKTKKFKIKDSVLISAD